MNLNFRITGILNEQEIDSELLSIPFEEAEKIVANKFQGFDVIVYLLTFGGGVTIIQLAKVIMKIIEKDKTKSFLIDGVEIKGYSYKQTKKLLEMRTAKEGANDVAEGCEENT
jgi:hypothetical protein